MTAIEEKPDIKQAVAATAARLRVLQLDLSEEPLAIRKDYLGSEVRQALEHFPQHQRPAFIEALAELFPTNDHEPAPIPKVAPPAEMSVPAAVEYLGAKGAQLPMTQREAMLARLREAWGIIQKPQPAPAAPPPPPPPPVRDDPQPSVDIAPLEPVVQDALKRIGLPASQRVDSASLVQLAGLMAEFALPLQPLVYRVWRAIDERSDSTDRSLQASVQSYVQGKNPSLSAELLQLRQLIAAMVNSLPHLAESFHEAHLTRFDPEEIEEAVKTESSFSLRGSDSRNWAKYRQMWPMLQPPAVADAIRQTAHDLIESCIHVTPARPREGVR